MHRCAPFFGIADGAFLRGSLGVPAEGRTKQWPAPHHLLCRQMLTGNLSMSLHKSDTHSMCQDFAVPRPRQRRLWLQADAEQAPQKVGVIKERCMAIMRAPRDNRAAIGMQLTKVRPCGSCSCSITCRGSCKQHGIHSTCTYLSRKPLQLALAKESGSTKSTLALQIARQVKDALREAQELAHPAATPGALESIPEGQQVNGHGPSLTAAEAEGPDAAAAHQDSDCMGGSSAGNGIYGVEDAVELMMIEGEPLSAGELAMAQAAEQVLCNLRF